MAKPSESTMSGKGAAVSTQQQYEGWIETPRGVRFVYVTACGHHEAHLRVVAQCNDSEFCRGVNEVDQ